MSYSRDDFKLTFYKDGAQFFINEEKRIVVCKVSAEINVPWDYESVVSIPWKKFEGEGIAKCSPEDVFDIERGKRIALAKAENQAYLNATRYLHNVHIQLEFFINRIDRFKDKALRHCVHNEDYMNSIHDKNHPMYKDNLNKIKHGYTNGKPNWDVNEHNLDSRLCLT